MKSFAFALGILGGMAYGQIQASRQPETVIGAGQCQGRPVSVIGAVKRPIVFQAAGDVTLLDALARAGGLLPEAGGEILLSHPASDCGRGLVRRISVKALFDGRDTALNVRLTGGEDIRVPPAGGVLNPRDERGAT